MAERYDVVIAGAGIAGLSLARLLARGGRHSVLLVEEAEELGGRFRVEERDGYALDWGVHACLFAGRGAIGHVLSKCPGAPEILPAGAAIYHDGSAVPFLGKTIHSVARQKVMSPSDVTRLGGDLLRVRGADWCRTSLAEWERRRKASGGLARAMRALCIGLVPTAEFEMASAGELFAFLRGTVRHWAAMGYPRGGWSAVLAALVKGIEGSGTCEIARGARLERISGAGGETKTLSISRRPGAGGTDSREVAARAVVCAFPPQGLAESGFIEPAPPAACTERLASLKSGQGVFIDVGLASPVTTDDRLIITVEPPALLWAVSNLSSEVAPPGRQLLQLFCPLSLQERADESVVQERVTGLVRLAEKVFAGPLEEEWRRVKATTIVGVIPFKDQSVVDRPRIEVPGTRGVFLIGDGVGVAGLGGEMAARSAIEAERLVSDYLRQA